MAIPPLTDETPLNQFVASSGQTDFNFTFYIFSKEDVNVYVNSVEQTLSTDYTILKSDSSTISDADLPLSGGKIVFNVGLSTDDEVSIARTISLKRLSGFSTAGAFRAQTVNTELTKMVAIMQDLHRDIDRSLGLAITDTGDTTAIFTLPDDRENKYLAFDSEGNLVATEGTSSETVISTFGQSLVSSANAETARGILDAYGPDSDATLGDTTLEDLTVKGKFNTTPVTETISSNSITYSGATIQLNGEGGAADTLTTINGGTEGDRVLLRKLNTSGTITIQDGVGNIYFEPSNDVQLGSLKAAVELSYINGAWKQVSRSGDLDFKRANLTNGYSYLSNGMLFQWGNNAVTTGTIVTFPIAFSTAFHTATTSHRGNNNILTHTYNRSGLTGIKLNHNGGGTSEISWWAVGH